MSAAKDTPVLIEPATRAKYDDWNRQRAEDGFGPFCGSYAGYLQAVGSHNFNVRLKHEWQHTKANENAK